MIMTGTQELIFLAFGDGACLYKDVLKTEKDCSSAQLRKAYHKRALCFHPDKQKRNTRLQEDNHNDDDDDDVNFEQKLKESTLRFQAVSAAYELLVDPDKRALYDATGSMGDEMSPHCHSSSMKQEKNRDWVQFFHSIFHELSKAGSDFDRSSYCGSTKEKDDVLKFYKLCKGDLSKTLSCIVCGEESDLKRWQTEIIDPAIQRGEINAATNPMAKKKMKRIKRKSRTKTKIQSNVRAVEASLLIDTDEEDDNNNHHQGTKIKAKLKMSKRDILEYRVAKKQKEKKERDIELARLIHSKQWSANSVLNRKAKTSKRPKGNTAFSGSFLSSLEKKFANK